MPSFAKYRTVTDKMFPDLRDQAHLRAFLVIWGVARSSPPVGICLKALETFIVPHFTQDLLRKSASPRVINTSSVSQAARLPAQYEMTRVNYNAYKAYEQSKLFNRMITVGQVGSFFQQELLFFPARLFKSSRSRKKFQIRIRLDYFKHVKFLLLFKIPYYQSKRGNNQLLSLSTVVLAWIQGSETINSVRIQEKAPDPTWSGFTTQNSWVSVLNLSFPKNFVHFKTVPIPCSCPITHSWNLVIQPYPHYSFFFIKWLTIRYSFFFVVLVFMQVLACARFVRPPFWFLNSGH